ncbi:MAG: hypothetical protein ABSH25_16190 [Syntrophorhabdales bacterium]|jgi:hypothetical protein
MAKRIKPEKVEELIRRFDAGTLSDKDRALVRRIMEECVRMGLVGKGPSKDDD